MPVPKLSRKFYEVFGDEVANQLVTWFNDVDTTYRDELRALNEANADRMAVHAARLEAKVEQRLAELRAEFHKEMGQLRGDVIRWTFMFWVGNTVTTGGLVFTMLKLML